MELGSVENFNLIGENKDWTLLIQRVEDYALFMEQIQKEESFFEISKEAKKNGISNVIQYATHVVFKIPNRDLLEFIPNTTTSYLERFLYSFLTLQFALDQSNNSLNLLNNNQINSDVIAKIKDVHNEDPLSPAFNVTMVTKIVQLYSKTMPAIVFGIANRINKKIKQARISGQLFIEMKGSHNQSSQMITIPDELIDSGMNKKKEYLSLPLHMINGLNPSSCSSKDLALLAQSLIELWEKRLFDEEQIPVVGWQIIMLFTLLSKKDDLSNNYDYLITQVKSIIRASSCFSKESPLINSLSARPTINFSSIGLSAQDFPKWPLKSFPLEEPSKVFFKEMFKAALNADSQIIPEKEIGNFIKNRSFWDKGTKDAINNTLIKAKMETVFFNFTRSNYQPGLFASSFTNVNDNQNKLDNTFKI